MTARLESSHGRKTEQAKQALVRYICDAGLRVGERLPPQNELMQRLGLSCTTVIRAINSLKADGIVEVRDKIGVFVISNDLSGKVGRTIALLPFHEKHFMSPFYAVLTLLIQKRLRRVCGQSVLFTCRHLYHFEEFGLKDFPGLPEAIEAGKIDGVIDMTGIHGESLQFLALRHIPVTYIGAPYPASHGVVIDLETYCREALAVLLERGCRQPMVITQSGYIRSVLFDLIAQFFAEHGLPFVPELAYQEADCIEDGRLLAQRICALPRERRPDGMVFMDEFLGHDLLAGLAVLEEPASPYRPVIVSGCNRQIPIAAPRTDIIYFEKDLEMIAELAIEHLLLAECAVSGDIPNAYYRMKPLPPVPFFTKIEEQP